MGEAVMRGVEAPEPLRRHQHQEPRDPRHHPIDPLGPEGGPMAALVQRGEQEDDQDAVRHEQQRPERHPERDRSARGGERTEVSGELHRPAPVRAAEQHRPLLPAERGDEGAMIRHRPRPCRRFGAPTPLLSTACPARSDLAVLAVLIAVDAVFGLLDVPLGVEPDLAHDRGKVVARNTRTRSSSRVEPACFAASANTCRAATV